MRPLLLLLVAALVATVPTMSLPSGSAQAAQAAQASEVPVHLLWRADTSTGFDGWALDGVRATEGGLLLDTASLPANDSPTMNAGSPAHADLADLGGLQRPSDRAGVAVGPVQMTAAPFSELIPSWNAVTPPGTWIEIRLRARLGGDDGRWTRWYELGSWTSDAGPDRRQSVKGQHDDDGRVSTDTLVLSAPASAHQMAFVLHSDAPTPDASALPTPDASPLITLAAVLASAPSPDARVVPPNASAWGTTVNVPERSQMVYAGGGPVWCSPTSTSMVMAYWADRIGNAALNQPVPTVAAAVYDPIYRGNGNWPFNTAYAGRDGLRAYVSRMSSLAQVEHWIAAGLPVVASLAWEPGELGSAAAVPSTNGHLLVIVGFTASGDVVVNDPAADPRLGLTVRRVYPRAALERLWLTHSGGTVYLIYPDGQQLPSSDAAFGAW